MKLSELLVLISSASLANSGVPPPHPAVVAVRSEEEFLPPYLRSPALRNQHLQNLLPLTSLLHTGESPVYQRPSDTVPRREIYKILTHAGFTPRQRSYQHTPTVYQRHGLPPSSYHNHYFSFSNQYSQNPDILQLL